VLHVVQRSVPVAPAAVTPIHAAAPVRRHAVRTHPARRHAVSTHTAQAQRGRATAPGQLKKAAPTPVASGTTHRIPPGRAKKAARTGAATPFVPPGQAKKMSAPPAAPTVPRGQAKKGAAPADASADLGNQGNGHGPKK
jgi:hypothetical protein